jgi:hypothetical protein
MSVVDRGEVGAVVEVVGEEVVGPVPTDPDVL